MLYLDLMVESQLEIKKSKFITYLFPIENSDDVSFYIQKVKKEHPKATHHCSASILGSSAEYTTANDDGEPARTAGIPILEVLKKNELTNILCIVVRYFGGVKLGSNGLIRAYSGSAVDAIRKATLYQKRIASSYLISFKYDLIDKINYLLNNKADIINSEFKEIVTYEIVFSNGDFSLLDDIKHSLLEIKELPSKELKYYMLKER